MRRHWSYLLFLLTFAVAAGAAEKPITVEGVRFPADWKGEAGSLPLAGYGVARYRIFIEVYAAALYASPGASRSNILDGRVARRLVVDYFHDIDAATLAAGANKVLDRQLSSTEHEELAARIRRFQSWYLPVREGDRYAMTYLPGEGTSLTLNGRPLGTIEGADFARAYFAIWLGEEEPLSEDLRKGLLRRLGER